jgi:hypothetical protein
MPFDWSGYLALAADLAARDDDEAAARSAISRAYYAALHRANERLAVEGIAVSPLRIHFQVRRAFRTSLDPDRAVVGLDLDWLRDRRTQADYAAALDGDPTALAQAAVRRAQRVLDTLDDLRSAPA